ncbi:hypothetical protein PybrP1_006016 [[Pythium] brassicae (nom. inval.)]|nr:hypothetical protein PybrP1_006016 [[Pythium] brassicae (nom. inval.)]
MVRADAIPLLAAADDFPLLHHPADESDVDTISESPSSSRRKRLGGVELNSSMGRLVRRRGRSSSVPADARAAAAAAAAARRDEDERQFMRTRAGSAAPTFAIASRRRAQTSASTSLLSRFRRRKNSADDDDVALGMVAAPKPRAKRRVHFKTSLYPEVVPDPRAHVPSYDELLFAVGGLYQTLSFLHDPPDDASTDSNGSCGGLGALDDGGHPPPPERSMQLMIAEFLFRSAVYLGYAGGGCTPWLPGFRDAKRFSVNDVKRWRRLAHHDWALEEQQLQATAAAAAQQQQRRQSSASSGGGRSGSRLRAVVTGWLQRRRRHSAPARLAMNHPPPVPAASDLSLLVAIANSCVYFGAFRLSARDILLLCNVDIDSKPATS